MRKLVILASIAALGIGGDMAAKAYAEGELASRAQAEGAASASADIESFPFVGKLLLAGKAGDITLSMKDVASERVTYSTVVIALVNVKLDKGKMMSRKVEITDIEKGTITVGFSAVELTKRLGLPVSIDGDKVTVSVGGGALAATPSVTAEGSIRFTASAGVPGMPSLNIPVPRGRIVSCPIARVEVDDGELRASCDITEIPPALVQAASRVVSG